MTFRRTLAIAAISTLVGCADFRGYLDAQLIASRNGYLARTAWVERGVDCCSGHKHAKDFKAGYYEGYLNVASGNGGIAPLVPPSQYWAGCYQDADGREMINDWFAGFNEGAFAASKDGVGEISDIPTWVGGTCCDENGKVVPRPESPDQRKPRRGDPPARAKLPPGLPPKAPKNSEANTEPSNVDPPKTETPTPSDVDAIDKMLLDPEGTLKKVPSTDKSAPKTPPKKDESNRKMKTAANKPGKTKVVDAPAEGVASAERSVNRPEPSKRAIASESMKPATMPASTQSTIKSNGSLPLNPFVKTQLEPSYPVAPPILSSGLKAPAIVEDIETPPPPQMRTAGQQPMMYGTQQVDASMQPQMARTNSQPMQTGRQPHYASEQVVVDSSMQQTASPMQTPPRTNARPVEAYSPQAESHVPQQQQVMRSRPGMRPEASVTLYDTPVHIQESLVAAKTPNQPRGNFGRQEIDAPQAPSYAQQRSMRSAANMQPDQSPRNQLQAPVYEQEAPSQTYSHPAQTYGQAPPQSTIVRTETYVPMDEPYVKQRPIRSTSYVPEQQMRTRVEAPVYEPEPSAIATQQTPKQPRANAKREETNAAPTMEEELHSAPAPQRRAAQVQRPMREQIESPLDEQVSDSVVEKPRRSAVESKRKDAYAPREASTPPRSNKSASDLVMDQTARDEIEGQPENVAPLPHRMAKKIVGPYSPPSDEPYVRANSIEALPRALRDRALITPQEAPADRIVEQAPVQAANPPRANRKRLEAPAMESVESRAPKKSYKSSSEVENDRPTRKAKEPKIDDFETTPSNAAASNPPSTKAKSPESKSPSTIDPWDIPRVVPTTANAVSTPNRLSSNRKERSIDEVVAPSETALKPVQAGLFKTPEVKSPSRRPDSTALMGPMIQARSMEPTPVVKPQTRPLPNMNAAALDEWDAKPSRPSAVDELGPPPPRRANLAGPAVQAAIAEPQVRAIVEAATQLEEAKRKASTSASATSAKPIAPSVPESTRPTADDGWGTQHDDPTADAAGRKK